MTTSISRPESCEIGTLIEDFFGAVQNGTIEFYNEFSFQHELGIYLRKHFPDSKVQFERNIRYFFDIIEPVKTEIDISVFSSERSDMLYTFEVKYPRNSQYPEQMYSFCKDIVFLEQLVDAGFEKAYFVAVVDDKLFYFGDNKDGIYAYFRSDAPIEGRIRKPTGRKNESVYVQGSYRVHWKRVCGNSRYCIVEVTREQLEARDT